MKEILKKYYFLPFIGFAGLFLVQVFSRETSVNPWYIDALIGLAISLVLAGLSGTLYYFIDTKFAAKGKEKRFTKSPLKDFLENGFDRYDDFLVGTFKKYTLIVTPFWSEGKPVIKVEIYFNPRTAAGFLTDKEIEAISKKHKKGGMFSLKDDFTWNLNAISTNFEYVFTPPKYDEVLNKAEEMIAILEVEFLKPVTYEQAQEIAYELTDN